MKSQNPSRRKALKTIATGMAALTGSSAIAGNLVHMENQPTTPLKGNIRHSVCQWCYSDLSLEDLCKAAVEIGISSVELVGPDGWPTLKKYGLFNAMPNGAELGLTKGFNDPQYHEELFKKYSEIIPKVADAGYDKIICFSGNRGKISDYQGLENCAIGLDKLMPLADKYKVTLTMELFNARDHFDYMGDSTEWGVALCRRLGTPWFKLLYDIYHMQIQEGDIIRSIRTHHEYINHYHTGGVPGRNEIDETQELFYPAIMRAILETGYKGFVGQEFIPSRGDALASLKQGVQICDV
jgi:hydroxypyruvate isomerase